MRRVVGVAAGLVCGLAVACGDEVPCAGEPAVGVVCTVAGTGEAALGAEGVAARASELYLPIDVAVADDGALYIADFNNHRVRVVRDGIVATVVGTGLIGAAPDGPARASALKHPTGVAALPGGDLVVAAWHSSRIVRYREATDDVVGVCGTGELGAVAEGAVAEEAEIGLPVSVARDPQGRLVFMDQAGLRLVRIDDDGRFETLAGDGVAGYSGDGGPGTAARFALPTDDNGAPAGLITVGPDGAIYFADTLNGVVRRVDADGTITTVAGAVGLGAPTDVALDPAGRLLVVDQARSCVLRLEGGALVTVAGRCGERGYTGDGGPADEALLDRPYGIAVDAQGRLWIADTHNHVVRVMRLPP